MEIRRQAEQPPEAVVDGRIPFCERPTCSINEACRAVGFGRTKLYDLIDEGLVETIKIGRRRFVRVPSLLAFLGRCQYEIPNAGLLRRQSYRFTLSCRMSGFQECSSASICWHPDLLWDQCGILKHASERSIRYSKWLARQWDSVPGHHFYDILHDTSIVI